jgi:hypothetical protein
MLISKSAAAAQVQVTKQQIEKWQFEIPLPGFFVLDHLGKYKIEDSHPEWKIRKEKMLSTAASRLLKNHKNSESKKKSDEAFEVPEGMEELSRDAARAQLEKEISEAKIKKEKALQEEIKTAEIKRDLAPMYMVKHFFSFAEKILQRVYRKPNDIEPQLSALFLAGENKKATAFLIRELESIIVEIKKELIEEIKKEGYKIKNEISDMQ